MAQRRLLIKSHPRREAPRTTFADPTRTGGLRRQFVAELRRQFSQLKADLLRYQQSEMVANVFCPTGEGGGVDPTCSPGGSAVHFGDLSKDVQTRISVAPWDSLNPELRDPTLIRGQEFHQDRVRKTDELFKHAVELRRPEKFIRGVSGTVYPMKAGETFTEPGYLRLSNDQSTAEGFTERPGKTGQVLHLTVPKGSRVLPGDHVREHEIYLPRGASFRVTRVESKENDLNIQGVMQHIHHIHAELVTSKGVNNSLALDSFSAWLEERARQILLSSSQERLWGLLVDSAFRRGATRAFDDVVPRSVSRDKMEFDRGSREGFLTALMAEGMPTDQVMTTNEGGVEIDCGANAPGGGGFQPGNTCARGEKSGKPGREQIIKDAADRIEVTDEIVKEDPIDDDDLDAIEERMTEEEINQMQEVMDAWKESYADSYEEDHNYDFDEDDVARGADWDDGEVHSRAMSAVDGLDIDDESKALAKTEIEAWYQDTRLHGEDAARELEKHLRNSGVHDEVLSEVRSIRDTAAEEIQAHRDTLVERERADRRERFIDQYDDSGDRREYLRDFYDRHSHEYRFSGGFKKEGSWGKDVDGDLTYGFTTSQGNKYEVWSFDKFKEGDVHVREFGFKDAEGSHGVTGAGGAHEVFKTVSSAMTAVISKKDLPAVYFSASEESRQRLYDRLVKTVAKVLPEYAAVAVPATDKTPKGYIVAKRSLIPTLREHAEKRGIGSKFEVLVNASRWIELEPDFQSEWIGLTDYVSNALLSRLRTAFDTVKALAKRAWDEFKGGVRGMVQGVQRAATDGVLQGKSPQKVAREAVKVVDRAFEQAKGLVQTEVTRAHAKGQLVGFVALGVKEVGVLVEWRVKRDANGQIASTVCPSCRAMEGVVLKISEADGLIPLHPRCMCAYSKPRENVKGQKRSKGDIDKAIAKARARRKAKPGQGWGAKVRIAQKRPTGNRDLIAEFSERIENVFCPTGPGGGVDPTCSPHLSKVKAASDRAADLFGVDRPEVKFHWDDSGKVSGEHGTKINWVVNPDHEKLHKGLNFKTDVSEPEHIAAHEAIHHVYEKNSELGREMSDRLSKVQGPHGSSVSLYGAFSGKFENLIELGASYSHSPKELKSYSPEMYNIAEDWAKKIKEQSNGKGS